MTFWTFSGAISGYLDHFHGIKAAILDPILDLISGSLGQKIQILDLFAGPYQAI